ncbi:HD domain-containing protein, partial [bacterium]|nr:HD domain-containing protein [bacterium]
MNQKSNSNTVTIDVEKLNKTMTILAYTGFSAKYRSIDDKTRAFLTKNFKGTRILVDRKGKKLNIPIEEAEVGDTIIQIFAFPVSLEKLTRANPKLATILKKYGILQFKVQQIAKLSDDYRKELQDAIDLVNLFTKKPSEKQRRLQEGIRKANQLVEKVIDGENQRKKGENILENMMDNARQGRINISDIENFIENIVNNSSTDAMKAIMSLKASDQTYGHCIDVGVLFEPLYFTGIERLKKPSDFTTKKEAMLGAFLHDFGKSKVSKDILDSTVRFELGCHEMEQIRSHPIHGAKLLNGMNMPDVMINMTLYHHVKMDESLNNSYPIKLEYRNSSFATKLLAIVDIYQALVGERSYKRSWTPPQTIRYLSALAGIEFDEDIWDIFVCALGEYPIGSLVVL